MNLAEFLINENGATSADAGHVLGTSGFVEGGTDAASN